MKSKTIRIAALAAALLATAACSSRRPTPLPPAPASGTDAGADTSNQGADPNAPTPGTQAHFLRSVPADRVFFDTDQYSLSAQARATLDSQAEYLRQYPAVTVTIEGHADERGTREYNLGLGDRRANSVKTYLESRGISPARMTTISWGKERPEVEGSTESAWSQNRRAVTVLPN